jgi:polyisoprenoid-binding protein YceI
MKKLLIIVALCLLAANAQAGEWHVDKKAKDNLITFTSEVVSLTFDGTTDQVDGYIYWEGEKLFEKNDQFVFEVELASFDTGIGKRNRDMRDVLSTKKWPKAVFKGEIAQHRPDSTANTYIAKAKGTFSMHGVEHKIEVPVQITIEDGHSTITAAFTVRLEDYAIEAPSLIAFVKMSEEVAVSVRLTMEHMHQGKDEK